MRSKVLGNIGAWAEVQSNIILGNIDDQDYDKWILKDEANKLNVWQKPSALEHWKGAHLFPLHLRVCSQASSYA
jgi:hypothetical protein